MNSTGEPTDLGPRWLPLIVVIAAIAGVVLGIWLFGAMT
jgi:hypothetical protein